MMILLQGQDDRLRNHLVPLSIEAPAHAVDYLIDQGVPVSAGAYRGASGARLVRSHHSSLRRGICKRQSAAKAVSSKRLLAYSGNGLFAIDAEQVEGMVELPVNQCGDGF